MDFCGSNRSQLNLSQINAEPHLEDKHEALSRQYEALKKHCTSLSETINILGDITELKSLMGKHALLEVQLQQTQGSKQELIKLHANQLNEMKETVEALEYSREVAEEKILLQTQMHADRVRKIEVTHNILKDRCRAMAVSAEQNRVDKLRQETHKGGDINLANQEIASLRSKLGSYATESKLLQGRVDAAETLLKSHPINSGLNLKTNNILESSADLLDLAHATGGAEGLQCVGQVGEILRDLNRQLDAQRRLCSAWLDRV